MEVKVQTNHQDDLSRSINEKKRFIMTTFINQLIER
jgi:hypothetical protein